MIAKMSISSAGATSANSSAAMPFWQSRSRWRSRNARGRLLLRWAFIGGLGDAVEQGREGAVQRGGEVAP